MNSSKLEADGLIAGAVQTQSDARKEEKHHKSTHTDRMWQNRLLPLMAGMLVILTGFFFAASLFQLYYIHNRVEHSPQLDLNPAMTSLDEIGRDLKGQRPTDAAFADRLQYAKWKTLSLLEANVLQRRYHQAGVLLISRIWTRYLGFVTGMILVLVGAAFVLGKLKESSSNLGAESALWKVSVTTASPGLILAVLGTILMLATLGTNLDMQVNDGPVYLLQPPTVAGEAPAPLVSEDGTAKSRADSEILKDMRNSAAPKK